MIKDVGTSTLHGHIYVMTQDPRPVAYEYRHGLRTDLAAVHQEFLTDFFDFLIDHKLTLLLGPEVR